MCKFHTAVEAYSNYLFGKSYQYGLLASILKFPRRTQCIHLNQVAGNVPPFPMINKALNVRVDSSQVKPQS